MLHRSAAAFLLWKTRSTAAPDPAERASLVKRLRDLVQKEIGIECNVELVHRNTIPRTTSGKLARSAMRKAYLEGIEASTGGAEIRVGKLKCTKTRSDGRRKDTVIRQ